MIERNRHVLVESVSKTFTSARGENTIALQDVDLAARQGEFVTLVGPSGCGKSTLLYIIAGLEKPTRGRVMVDGELVTGPTTRCGIVFQEFRIFPWLTVRQNVTFGLDVRNHLSHAEREQIARRYLQMMGLEKFARHFPKELSGGMKQRVAIAQTLACEPDVVLMDEPFGSLDAFTRENLQDELLRVWQESRKTVLFVTHSIEEAIYLGQRVVVMSARPGCVVREFSVPLPYPRHTETRTSSVVAEMRQQLSSLIQDGAMA
jgi:ABC-type nitrate/sulfonate/bicarbonate transport system ATPase subunit